MANGRRILVTGMSGLIGGLAGRDLARDYRVRALNRRPVANDSQGFESFQADIADFDASRPAFDGVDTVVHVGPEPNLIPATFRRISENVKAQISGASPKSLGLRAVSTIWRPWLASWLSSKSALLRAPNVEHVILEDWLLENPAEE